MKDCIEDIQMNKVIPNSTQNMLRDIELDKQVFIKEICSSLDKESAS